MQTERFHTLLAGSKTLVMGILNVTPDSFSDGGVFLHADAATRHSVTMLNEGADIIDIGGQSTRPAGNTYGIGAQKISLDEELRRVLPVIDFLRLECKGCIISIDTTRAEVARRAIDSGATIINDVSAGTDDPDMFNVARELDASMILMHGYGPEFHAPTIEAYTYRDVVTEVKQWLAGRVDVAKQAGVRTILADIGFGFAKTKEHNIRLLRNHRSFESLGVPLVLGVSRKSTIGKLLGDVPAGERIFGSIGAAAYGALNGAKIIRTHDVKQTSDALRVIDTLKEQ